MSEFDVGSWVDERFPEGSDSVKNWMGRLEPRTAKDGAYVLKRWLTWASLNGGQFSSFSPDDFVSFQKNGDNGNRYEVLDLVQKYIGGLKLRANSKTKNYTSIRSFFLHNRAALPDDPFTIRSDVPKVKGKLTLEIFKSVVMSSNECYAAIFASMFQGGMGIGEFLYWNENGYEDLVKQLKGSPEHVRIEIPGRKHTKNKEDFYTFIGRDAIEKVRVWLKKRTDTAPVYHPEDMKLLPNERRVIDEKEVSAIFVNQYGDPIKDESLRTYWTRKLKRLGHIEQKGSSTSNRYGMNPHELRDLMRSRWRPSGVDTDVAEFMMGHSEALDKMKYDKSPWLEPEWFEDQYDEAQPWLNVFSEDPKTVPKKELDAQRRRIAELEAEVNKLRAEKQEYTGKYEDMIRRMEDLSRQFKEHLEQEK